MCKVVVVLNAGRVRLFSNRSGAHEAFRCARQQSDPFNGALAGAASGLVMGGVFGSARERILPLTLVFCVAGGVAEAAYLMLRRKKQVRTQFGLMLVGVARTAIALWMLRGSFLGGFSVKKG